jgi:hypothetical protein
MPRRKSKVEFTLFPFLSVLSGLIAVNVLLLIVVIGTRVIDPDGETPEAGEGGDAAEDAQVVPNGIDAESFKQLERQILTLEAALEKRRSERNAIRLKLRDIEGLIATKEVELDRSKEYAAPKTGERIGEPVRKRIIPRTDADGILKNPVFIEVSSTGFIVHPSKTAFPFEPKKDGKAEPPEGLKTLIAGIAKDSKDRYPLLLIHPNGAEAFECLGNYILRTHKGLNIGWEPFSREWLLDTASK